MPLIFMYFELSCLCCQELNENQSTPKKEKQEWLSKQKENIYTLFTQINSKLNNSLLNKLFCQFSTIVIASMKLKDAYSLEAKL